MADWGGVCVDDIDGYIRAGDEGVDELHDEVLDEESCPAEKGRAIRSLG